jgi:hypothetical protein
VRRHRASGVEDEVRSTGHRVQVVRGVPLQQDDDIRLGRRIGQIRHAGQFVVLRSSSASTRHRAT